MSHCLEPGFVVGINKRIVGPIHLVLDLGKLESALGRPLHTYLGAPLFPTVVQRAAALLDGLAQAHAFFEGNKRTAWISTMVYLRENNYAIRQVSDKESGGLVLDLVKHKIDIADAAIWLAGQVEQ